MLTRVGVVSDKDSFRQALMKAATGKGAEGVVIGAGDDLPANITAIVADQESVKAAMDAACVLGARNEQMLQLLAEAVDCREGFLPGSSVRVMEHATRFAAALKLSPEDQLTLERGALARDIGKIHISNDVLLKEGVLSYDEWSLLQRHPHLGAEIVLQTSCLQDTADIVRNHHECYDGDGYPDGLEGEAIPYLARIMKILDVYCAMTSPRHYRKGHSSHEEAVDYLKSEQGKHFDAAMVDVFMDAGVGQPWKSA